MAEFAEDDNILHVKMFGKFSMVWKGKALGGEAKSMESQFICLMELLLHHRDTGVTKSMLERALFEDRDIEDIHHALRSVIYNAKKRLKKYGLPDVEYIVRDKGIYSWTKEIPVVEDAHEMERIMAEAEAETDPARKKDLYLDACHCYTGEFLASQIGVIWIAKEARKYREMFFTCMDRTVELLRETHDYFHMESLGNYAASLHPLENWELVYLPDLDTQYLAPFYRFLIPDRPDTMPGKYYCIYVPAVREEYLTDYSPNKTGDR